MKLKKTLAIILTFIMCFGLLNIAFADESEEIPEGYTPIYTAEDLYNIRNGLDGKYILMNDIDLSVYENWEPIGTSDTPFTGELDGNGYSILNMTINGNYTENDNLYFALFTNIKNCLVTDLGIINIDINATFTGTSYKAFCTGALSGYANTSTVKNCISSGKIVLNEFYEGNAGGLFGKENNCSPTKCVNYTDIIINAKNIYTVNLGGIVGVSSNDTISECANYGSITVNSYDSDNEARTLMIGGVSGDNTNRGIVSNCFNQGNIDVDFCMPSIYVGGITGDCCVVENSYNHGTFSVPADFDGCIGGVSGDFWTDTLAVVPAPNIKNSYYINEGLHPSYVKGALRDNYDFENVKFLTEEEFRKQESFAGFDFENVWAMEENGYPVLRNQPKLSENIPEEPVTETTTKSTTENDANSSTESTTEPTTEPDAIPSAKPSNERCPLENLWVVKVIKHLFSYICRAIEYIADYRVMGG